MIPFTKKMVKDALIDMKEFHDAQKDLHDKFGIDFSENLGRRNIIMSHPQEKFFTKHLRQKYKSVIDDGRTGRPDIYIEDIDREIECKLTTRNASGAINLQSDFETLQNKKNLDYLYVIASPDFESFCVLYFEGLTTSDFRKLSPGARGKVSMKKHAGMKKCNILWGTAFDKNEVEVKKLSSLTQDVAEGHLKRMTNLQERLLSAKASKHNPVKKIEKLKSMLKNQEMRYSKKIGAIQDRKRYWEETPEKFSFILQTVSAE